MKTEWGKELALTTEPPPPRVPRPISASTTTHGHRVVTTLPDGYRRDLRGYGNPYYRLVGTELRWERDANPPEGVNIHSPAVVLVVDVCTEPAWYAWQAGGPDPVDERGVFPVNTALTWIE